MYSWKFRCPGFFVPCFPPSILDIVPYPSAFTILIWHMLGIYIHLILYLDPCLFVAWSEQRSKYPWKFRCPLSQYWYRSCHQVIGQLYIVSHYPWYILIDYIKVWSQSLLVGVAMYPWKFRCPISQYWYRSCLQVIGIWYTVSYYPWVKLTVYIKVWS